VTPIDACWRQVEADAAAGVWPVPTLSQYLDRGGDFADVEPVELHRLARAALLPVLRATTDDRRRFAAALWLAAEEHDGPLDGDAMRRVTWLVEMMLDDRVARRFARRLPLDLLDDIGATVLAVS
jgi:predicted nucleic acid-binding protein